MPSLDPLTISIDEAGRRRFEAAWAEGRPRPIEDFLPGDDDPRYLPTLEELVCIELELAWKARTDAAPPTVERYVARFPPLGERSILLRLLQQEWLAQQRHGGCPNVADYQERFPALAVDATLFAALTVPSQPRAADASAALLAAAAEPELPRPFGHYELREELGRGGMGIVYRAWQAAAGRTVALKVIRRDFLHTLDAGSQSTAMERFRHEIQAAARLDHENIVAVYEVGEVAGEPFFSMRFVDGRSLGELVRAGPLEGRLAAQHLEPIARAVEHAHRQGILHRDLKPQNILIESATGRPFVADFGLAKLQESQESLTQSGDVMGSPPYMPPEQARDAAHVTVRSDVYALGATLYHVLTGRPPFQAATWPETIRQVMSDEPVPPRRLNFAIDRDLETICLKCLEKEPSRRYVAAGELADDLRRFLNREPIQARPVGRLGRAARWCRRNPVVAGLMASTAICLLLALVASVTGYVRTAAALKTAEARYRDARETVDRFYTRVSEDTLLNQPGMQPLRHELLQQALDYYRQFLRERGDDPTIRDELAMTHFRIGRITEAIESPEKALAWYRSALGIAQALVAERPTAPERLELLGDTWNAIGAVLFKQRQLDDAGAAYREAIAIRTRLAAAVESCEPLRTLANSYMNLGLVEQDAGDLTAARSHFEQAQEQRREILARQPTCPDTRRDLAMGCYNLANLCLATQPRGVEEAQTNFQSAISLLETLLAETPDKLDNQYRLATCCRRLADLDSICGRAERARELYGRALRHMETLAQRNPTVRGYQADLAGLYMNVGQLDGEQNRSAGAAKSLQRAREILADLVARYPEVPGYQRDLAVTHLALASLDLAAGESAAAAEQRHEAQKVLRQLVSRHPESNEYRELLQEIERPPDAAPLDR